MKCDLNEIEERQMTYHIEKWKTEVLNKPKLRFYKCFKKNFETELYVKMNLTSVERSYLAQLRFGILPLNVEVGRYRSIKLEDRKCEVCDMNCVEDEKHFLFKCTKYQELRTKWLTSLGLTYDNDTNLDTEEIYETLFKFPRQTAKFIISAIEYRKENPFL